VIKEARTMNKWIILFSLVAACVSCNRKSAEEVAYEHYKDSIREELMKIRFDTAAFNRVATFFGENWAEYTYTDSDSVYIEIITTRTGYQERRFYPNSPYRQVLKFNSDGSLKYKFNKYERFIIGEHYELDSLGNLNIEDYDEPYTYSMDSVKNLLQSQGYDINSKDIEVFRSWYQGAYIYSISIRKENRERKIVLDGITGEVYLDNKDDWYVRGECPDDEVSRYEIDSNRLIKILKRVAARRGIELHEEDLNYCD